MSRSTLLKVYLILLALAFGSGNLYASGPVLTAAPSNTGVALTWVLGGPNLASQTWATAPTITLSAAVADANIYTVTVSTTQTGAPSKPWVGGTIVGTVQGSASTTATITVAVKPGAGNVNLAGVTAGTYPFTFKLAIAHGGSPVDDVTISGTLTVLNSPLNGNPLVLQSFKNSASAATANASVTGISNLVFTVDPATLPFWLTSTCLTVAEACTANTPGTPTFTVSTSILGSFNPGNYPVNVGLKTANYTGEFYLSVTLQLLPQNPGSWHVTDGNGNLLTAGGTTTAYFAYSSTTPSPTTSISVVANSDPVSFTVGCTATTSNGTAGAGPCQMKDVNGVVIAGTANVVAYPWGSMMTANPDPSWFQQQIGAVVNVAVTVTVGATVQTYNIAYTFVGAPVTLTAAAFPTSAQPFTSSGSLMVMLTGTSFVGTSSVLPSSGFSATQVWYADTVAHLTNPGSSPYSGQINTSNIMVDSTGTHMYFTIPGAAYTNKVGNVIYIGVANQSTSTALVHLPSGGANTSFRITANPVVTSMANAASYAVPSIGTASVAPYELVSLFGNFVPASDIPTANNGIVGANPDSFGKYPTTLKVNTAGNTITVGFYTDPSHSQATLAFNAPILFATPTQINAIVPSGLTAGTPYYVSVDYYTVVGSTKTNNYSDSFTTQVIAADPGVFTLGSDGHGQGALIVAHNNAGAWTYLLNNSTNKAKVGDILEIYLTGLGLPDSSDPDDTSTPNGLGCIQDQAYASVINALTPAPTTPWTNIDGAVMLSANLLGGHLAPCLGVSTLPVTVTFYDPAGVAAPITATATYAGFVANSVAGLYQVNVTVPDYVSAGFGSLASGSPIAVSVSSIPTNGGSISLGSSAAWATVMFN